MNSLCLALISAILCYQMVLALVQKHRWVLVLVCLDLQGIKGGRYFRKKNRALQVHCIHNSTFLALVTLCSFMINYKQST